MTSREQDDELVEGTPEHAAAYGEPVLCEVCGGDISLGDEPGEVWASGRWVEVCSVACTEAALAADPEE